MSILNLLLGIGALLAGYCQAMERRLSSPFEMRLARLHQDNEVRQAREQQADVRFQRRIDRLQRFWADEWLADEGTRERLARMQAAEEARRDRVKEADERLRERIARLAGEGPSQDNMNHLQLAEQALLAREELDARDRQGREARLALEERQTSERQAELGLPQFGEAPALDIVELEKKVVNVRRDPAMQPTSSRRELVILREALLSSAHTWLVMLDRNELRGSVTITFRSGSVVEPSIDAGGPTREFYTLVARKLFGGGQKLFRSSASSDYRVVIDPRSRARPGMWRYYTLAGRFLGLAFFHNHIIGTKFGSGFCKDLCGIPVDVEDLKDAGAYDQYVSVRDAESIDGWGLTFSVEEEENGRNKPVTLIRGRSVDEEVTDENKHEYLAALMKYYLDFGQQMMLIRKGFFAVVRPEVLEVFKWIEIRYLFSGADEIDIGDWKSNTVYKDCHEESEVVLWFWDVVEKEMSEDERAGLLQYVTGSPFVPITGFKDLQGSDGKAQKFTILYKPGSESIQAHTCFNVIEFPAFEDREVLELALKDCATKGNVGFDMI